MGDRAGGEWEEAEERVGSGITKVAGTPGDRKNFVMFCNTNSTRPVEPLRKG